MYRYRRYSRYVPVHVRHAQAAEKMHKLRARGVKVQPVDIKGRDIAESFWGQRWCEHLESFADYANRLRRGRTYVWNGSVCHLAIKAGTIEAVVSGSEPYKVVVRVRKLARPAWKAIKTACAGQIASVVELLQGRLSGRVMDIVTHRDTGLLPKPRQIEMECDCLDWATMCKHVAAVLYGVGNRLDDRPELLFRLRGVDEAELIATDLALPRTAATADTLAEGDLGSIFGIDIDAELAPSGRKRAARTAPGREKTKRGRANGSSPRFTGARIAGMREQCGFSVAEFARLLRVSGATVRRWEAAPGPLDLHARTRDALTALRAAIERRQPGRARA